MYQNEYSQKDDQKTLQDYRIFVYGFILAS